MATIAPHFENFEAFLADCETAVSSWQGYKASRKSGGDMEDGWAGASWTGALEIARKGWTEGRERIARGLAMANTLNKPAPRRGRFYDVAGAFPHVARAVAGDPACMANLGDTYTAARPIVRLIAPRAASAIIKPAQIENFGIALLSHIDAMENEGYSVELVIAITCKAGDDFLDCRIVAKKAGEPLDVDRLAFMLAHPAFFRRLGFAMIENHCKNQDRWQMGYGSPCRLKPEQIEPDQNYVPGPQWTAGHVFDTLDSALREIAKVRPGYTATSNDGELGQA